MPHDWNCSIVHGQGFEQLALVEGVPAHGRGVGLDL